MAKIGLTKLGLKQNNEIKTITFNDQVIEVKQYLSVQEKLGLIGNIINFSHDGNNFSNPVKVSVFTTLEIMYNYTNINFTDKQKEDPAKLYDLLISSGLATAVIQAIPEAEYNEVLCGIADSIDAVYAYQNSVLGILDTISSDYSNLQLNINDIKNKLTNPEQIATLKELSQISGLYELNE